MGNLSFFYLCSLTVCLLTSSICMSERNEQVSGDWWQRFENYLWDKRLILRKSHSINFTIYCLWGKCCYALVRSRILQGSLRNIHLSWKFEKDFLKTANVVGQFFFPSRPCINPYFQHDYISQMGDDNIVSFKMWKKRLILPALSSEEQIFSGLIHPL